MFEKITLASYFKCFPFIEGISIFVGVLAWDLLYEGEIQLLKAASIALTTSFIWFAIRQWKNRPTNTHAQ